MSLVRRLVFTVKGLVLCATPMTDGGRRFPQLKKCRVPKINMPHGHHDVCGFLSTNASNVHTNLDLQAEFRRSINHNSVNKAWKSGNIKFALEQVMKTQRGRKGIAPLFL